MSVDTAARDPVAMLKELNQSCERAHSSRRGSAATEITDQADTDGCFSGGCVALLWSRPPLVTNHPHAIAALVVFDEVHVGTDEQKPAALGPV